MQTQDADLVGTVLGGYKVLEALGTGTMGAVYAAEHQTTGLRVALKILHAHHQGSEAAARFIREGKTLALFDHENIVELLEVGEADDGTLFLATEEVRGVSLRDLLNDGAVEPRRALSIMRQVLEALGAAHAVGVVHRDVKPENVMLADGGRADGTDLVKVLDFGVAKLLGDTPKLLGEGNLTQVGLSVFGSPDYIAPETALGKTIDQRADLYSVGAVLYELLTGKPQFDAQDPTEILRLAITTQPQTLAQRAPNIRFTPQIEFLVKEALAKEPDKRFGSTAEMIAALDSALHSLDGPSSSASFQALMSPPPPSAALIEPEPMFVVSPSTEATTVTTPAPRGTMRGPDVGRIIAWARAHKRVLAASCGALLLVFVVVRIVGARNKASAGAKGDASSYVSLGHERFNGGRRADAIAAYERALMLSPSLADNGELRDNVQKIVESKDVVAAVIALELLATRMGPMGRDAVAGIASTGKLFDVRHRAVAIAERDGFDAKIDRVESISLDLQQATGCDDRKVAIDKLGELADKRAVAALKKAKAIKCVEKDATAAITRLEGSG